MYISSQEATLVKNVLAFLVNKRQSKTTREPQGGAYKPEAGYS